MIDPAWEYWVPDPEVEEVLYPRPAPGFDGLGLDRRDWRAAGFRFGSGNPNSFHGRYGRAAPPRPEAAPPVAARCPWCRGHYLRPAAQAHRRYCSRDCQAAARRCPPRACGGCGAEFRPDRNSRDYCSRACVPRRGRPRVVPDRVCAACGGPFRPRHQTSRCCSVACLSAARTKLAPRPCRQCGGLFRPRHAGRVVCSVACRGAAKRTIAPVRCGACGVEFRPPEAGRKFCSIPCRAAGQRRKAVAP